MLQKKLILIKKIRDFYFIIKFGKGKNFSKFLLTQLQFLIKKNGKNEIYSSEVEEKRFTNTWFDDNIKYLKTFLKNKNNNIKKILEIGSYEGNSTVFFLNYFNFSIIHCVDIWTDQNKNYQNINFKSVEDRFDKNLINFKDRIIKIKLNSKKYFQKRSDFDFDLVFIDGSHYYKHVYADAINAFKVVKINGYILFDDYLFKYRAKENAHPIYAINKFLNKYKNKIKIIAIYRQVLIQKISE